MRCDEMPKYDAFGRPVSGDVSFSVGPPTVVRRPRHALAWVVLALVFAAFGAIKLAVALHSPPEPSPLPPRPPEAAPFDLSRTLLAPGRLATAFAAGMRRAQRNGHGRLEGVVVGYDSLDLQFGPRDG